MPLSELQLSPNGLIAVQTVSAPIERGILTALSVLFINPTRLPDQAYVRAGLCSYDSPPFTLAVTLCSGYLQFRAGPSWSGRIKLLQGFQMALLLNSTTTIPIRLSWITE